MSPYEHFFWNYVVIYRKPWAWKAGIGGVFPDLIYIFAFIPKLFSYQNFHEWMTDSLWDKAWNSFTAKAVHSIAIWSLAGLLILVAALMLPFLLGWGLHILTDAFTHVSDGYALFFPLSSYRFSAPVSYWEAEYFGREFFWISHSLMAGLLLIWAGSKIMPIIKNRQSIK